MKKKGLLSMILTISLALSASITSFAGWEQEGSIWRYSQDGTYLTGWHWLDGNGDGVSECYYFYDNHIMASNTMVEGYTVNLEGQWTVNGVVQTKSAETLSEGEIAGIDRTRGKNFIKQEFMDCIGRNKAYVDSRLGQPIKEEQTDYRYLVTYKTASDMDVFVSYVKGVAKDIYGDISVICNIGNNSYSYEEVDQILGVTHDEGELVFKFIVWRIQENPVVDLTHFPLMHNFHLELSLPN